MIPNHEVVQHLAVSHSLLLQFDSVILKDLDQLLTPDPDEPLGPEVVDPHCEQDDGREGGDHGGNDHPDLLGLGLLPFLFLALWPVLQVSDPEEKD